MLQKSALIFQQQIKNIVADKDNHHQNIIFKRFLRQLVIALALNQQCIGNAEIL